MSLLILRVRIELAFKLAVHDILIRLVCLCRGCVFFSRLVVLHDHIPELGSVADEALETGSAHWV